MTDLKILIDHTIDAIDQRDALSLRKLSTKAISEAALEGHRELILLGLVDYALSKVMSKVHYQDIDKKFYEEIKDHFRDAKAGPKEETIRHLEAIEDLVIKLDEVEGNYSRNVIDQARIKKAAKLYDQGLSLRRASELTGADPAEVLNFVGGSKIHEFKGAGKNANRLKIAREVFK